MKTSEIIQIGIIGAVAVGGALIAIANFTGPDDRQQAPAVVVPELSAAAVRGEQAFAANCAVCHGVNGTGTDSGPPLVHDIYNPGHHGDQAFYRAVSDGVRAHHWRFGNMPPQPQVSRRQVADIIQYVRELQRANGIEYREHRM